MRSACKSRQMNAFQETKVEVNLVVAPVTLGLMMLLQLVSVQESRFGFSDRHETVKKTHRLQTLYRINRPFNSA